MLLVDTVQGKVIDDDELKEKYAKSSRMVSGWTAIWYSLKDIKIPNKSGRIYMSRVHACRKHSDILMSSTVLQSETWH